MNDMSDKPQEEAKEYKIGNLDKIWFEYDSQNDILYINFGLDIEEADESFLTDDNIVIRLRNGKVIGITVFDFMKRIGQR